MEIPSRALRRTHIREHPGKCMDFLAPEGSGWRTEGVGHREASSAALR